MTDKRPCTFAKNKIRWLHQCNLLGSILQGCTAADVERFQPQPEAGLPGWTAMAHWAIALQILEEDGLLHVRSSRTSKAKTAWLN